MHAKVSKISINQPFMVVRLHFADILPEAFCNFSKISSNIYAQDMVQIWSPLNIFNTMWQSCKVAMSKFQNKVQILTYFKVRSEIPCPPLFSEISYCSSMKFGKLKKANAQFI